MTYNGLKQGGDARRATQNTSYIVSLLGSTYSNGNGKSRRSERDVNKAEELAHCYERYTRSFDKEYTLPAERRCSLRDTPERVFSL